MKVPAKLAMWLLPLFLIAGCGHKVDRVQSQTLAPPIEEKPLPPPSNASVKDLPPPVLGETKPALPPPQQPEQPQPEPKKPVHHAKKPPLAPVLEASNGPAPSVSAIGQLSQGASRNVRSETSDYIDATEKRLNGVTRPLSDTEQKTAMQIREFLKQAREALNSGDVDGAHTLADKAKVLLAELNQ